VVWPTGHEPQLQWWFLFRKYVITRMRVARAELSMIYLAGWDFELDTANSYLILLQLSRVAGGTRIQVNTLPIAYVPPPGIPPLNPIFSIICGCNTDAILSAGVFARCRNFASACGELCVGAAARALQGAKARKR
jgi:hypothetical protein